MIDSKPGLTFDDVLLVPKYSDVLPADVDTSGFITQSEDYHHKPFVSAAMDTVTTHQMAIAMAKYGGLGIIHKNMDVWQQTNEVELVHKANAICGAAIGVGSAGIERARALIDIGCNIIVVDSAHGHSKGVVDTVRELVKLKNKSPIQIVAGNVATYLGAKKLIDTGADVVKVGIGPGSICSTRIVAGVGVPQLTAIRECVRAANGTHVKIWADGGIKHSGDVVKALAAGADAVMLGSLLAGCDESAGTFIKFEDKMYKTYRGMGSVAAMQDGSKDRYGQAGVTDSSKLVPEGVEALAECHGNVESVLFQLEGGLRSGMGYLGAENLYELRNRAEFIMITNAGLRESHVHDVKMVGHSPNYKP